MLVVWLLSSFTVLVAAFDTEKSGVFCDVEAKDDNKGEFKCCNSNLVYHLNAGVCDNMKIGPNLDQQIFGYSARYSEKPVTPDEAGSDHGANEDDPGHDEGMCHVYKIKVGGYGGKCVPGNMVMAAKNVQDWLSANHEGVNCSIDVGADCSGRPDAARPYNFAIKLSGADKDPSLNTESTLSSTLRDVYRCNIEEQSGVHYVVCPL